MRNFIIASYDKNCDIFHRINETIVARYLVHSIALWIRDISFLIMKKFHNRNIFINIRKYIIKYFRIFFL